jgi:hypothetical protein
MLCWAATVTRNIPGIYAHWDISARPIGHLIDPLATCSQPHWVQSKAMLLRKIVVWRDAVAEQQPLCLELARTCRTAANHGDLHNSCDTRTPSTRTIDFLCFSDLLCRRNEVLPEASAEKNISFGTFPH